MSMEQNTFLLPDSWSDSVQMTKADATYRTYVSSRGGGRYINLEYRGRGETLNVEFRGNDIFVSNQDITKKSVTAKRLLEIVQSIYEEKHSFIESAEGIRGIREKIAQRKATIHSAKEGIKKLEVELSDLLLLK